MYIYIYIYVYIYIYIYMHINTYVYYYYERWDGRTPAGRGRVRPRKRGCAEFHTLASSTRRTYHVIYMSLSLSVYIYICICTCITHVIYIYIYIYIYTHTSCHGRTYAHMYHNINSVSHSMITNPKTHRHYDMHISRKLHTALGHNPVRL